MDTNAMLEQQRLKAQELERMEANYKKDGPTRRNLEYLTRKLRTLEDMFADFRENHLALEENLPKTDPYFTENLFELGEKQYLGFKARLEQDYAVILAKTGQAQCPVTSAPPTTYTSTGASSSTANISHNQAGKLQSDMEAPKHKVSASTTNEVPNREDFPSTHTPNDNPAHTSGESTFGAFHGPTATASDYSLHGLPKLPPIQIPKFYGGSKEWRQFIELFKAVIDCNYLLGDIQKLQYLLSYLEGDAQEAVAHLQLSPHNYRAALSILEERFSNQRQAASDYIDAIIDCTPLQYRVAADVINMFNTVRNCLAGLTNMGYGAGHWGPMIVRIVMRKFDPETLRIFEESLANNKNFPTIDELCTFLLRRHQLLTTLKPNTITTKRKNCVANYTTRPTPKSACVLCKGEHKLFSCLKFKEFNSQQRMNFVNHQKLCSNCLSHDKNSKCNSKIKCYECNGIHHTLLHVNKNSITNIATEHKDTDNFIVLLSTALIKIEKANGQSITLRALIDNGSQLSFISFKAANILSLPKQNVLTTVTGIGGMQAGTIRKKMQISISPLFSSDYKLIVEAHILPKLDTILPEKGVKLRKPAWVKGLRLADPTFNKSSEIDLILGTDVIEHIIEPQIKKGQPLFAQKTKIGWLLSGKFPLEHQENTKNVISSIATVDFHNSIQKFFEMDADDGEATIDNEETEIIYQTTTTRNPEGRYVVSLPFKDTNTIPPLGNSRNKAMIIYKQLEKKLNRDPSLKLAYNQVLQEYLDLGHMRLASPYIGEEHNVYYLPHHAVIKSGNSTTKVRVVFNASAKTTSGSSLNDLLLTGKQLQDTLARILLRWRTHRFVYVADIEKMFRMVEIHPDFYDYHRILWRPQDNGPILEYVVTVVLFGETPSNFLAVRTMQQLAEDERQRFPIAAEKVKKDFYVDNLMTGAKTRAGAKQIQEEMIPLLRAGGFNIRQWATNDKILLENIPEELRDNGLHNIGEDPTINTLGIQWNPIDDSLRFKTLPLANSEKITKRQLLANIATIYDPLQWLAPMTISAKILMQKVWQSGIDWDDSPSEDILLAWKKIESQLSAIESIRVPRWIQFSDEHRIELHGFCDASEAAYAAVIYSRTTDSLGKVSTTLLCARTKVTPIKAKITLPRLELNGALLLAQLMEQTSSALCLENVSTHCWCDSQIVLAWIQKEPSSLENYIGNRIAKIQKLSKKSWTWSYVKSKDNPADCASRGVSPQELVNHELWWKGPQWLQAGQFTTILSFSGIAADDDYFLRFSNFAKLVRVTSYCRRFLTKTKGPITFKEFEEARIAVLRELQRREFDGEIARINEHKPLEKKLRNLNPFIDQQGVLRVGGRLRHADIEEDYKHPILLPKGHHITHLIIREAHEKTMHGTIDMVRNYLRMRYWIVNDRKGIRYEIHRCLTCLRYNNRPNQQMMGDYPIVRITPTHPFSNCGVDFAGPFLTRASKGRATVTLKGYICVFVCMVTKAIHLELVSDLSTEAFLAAFKRFTSRRGMCREIYSDNGTNFKGASTQIDKELQEAIQRCTHQIAQITAKDGITWKFIPVATPHFGGLWEAGVKSAKRHIKCIFDELKIIPTFEEFTTILCQVEACLNSRPLVSLSSNPNDLEALTPAHFLASRTLMALPEVDRTQRTLYERWEQLKQVHQVFWRRWKSEYLHNLQTRAKWDQEAPNMQVGQLVLIRGEDTPPTKWPLARIKEVYPGKDDRVRTVLVQYHGNKTKKIGIVNLCKLPIDVPVEPEPRFTTKKSNQLTTVDSKRSRKRPERSDIACPSTTTHRKDNEKTMQRHKKPKIAPCTWAKSLLNIALLFLTFGTVFSQNVSTEHYQVWKPSAGYHVEKLGLVNIIRGSLRMEVDFPISDILDDQRNLILTLNNTSEMCKRTQDLVKTTHCNNLLQHISMKYSELATIMNEVLNIPIKRKPRGMLGKMMTAIFGINDEAYTDIEILQRNQQTLLQTTTQQNILISTRLETLKFLTAAKFDEFGRKINDVVDAVNSMKGWFAKIDHVKLSVEVISTYITAIEYYNELEKKYTKFSSILHGRGHLLNFVSWDIVKDTTRTVSMKLGPQYAISNTPQDRNTIIRTQNEIIIYGYFYIKESSAYELLHITAIPHKAHPGQFLVPRVITPLLAVNFNQESYFELDEQELNSCKAEDEIRLCIPKLTKNINLYPNCIIDTIYERPNTQQCPSYPVTNNGTVWKQLAAPNSWLFVSNEAITASIICEGERFEIGLKDVGIIHALDGCVISAGGISLRPSISEARKVLATLTKPVLPIAGNLTNSSVLPRVEVSKISNQIFEPPSLSTGITTSAIEEMKHHNRTLTIVTSILFSVAFMAMLILFCKRKMQDLFHYKTRQEEVPLSNEEIPLSKRLEKIIARPPEC